MAELRALGDCKRRPDKNFLSFGKRKTSFWIRSGGLVGVATFYDFRNNFKRSDIFDGALVSCVVHDNILLSFFCTTFQLYRPVTHLPFGIGNFIPSHEKNMQLKRTLFMFMVPDATTDPLLCLVGHVLFTIFLFDPSCRPLAPSLKKMGDLGATVPSIVNYKKVSQSCS